MKLLSKLTKRAGVSPSHLSRFLNGDRAMEMRKFILIAPGLDPKLFKYLDAEVKIRIRRGTKTRR